MEVEKNEPVLDDHLIDPPQTAKDKERQAYEEGIEDGVKKCVELIRQILESYRNQNDFESEVTVLSILENIEEFCEKDI